MCPCPKLYTTQICCAICRAKKLCQSRIIKVFSFKKIHFITANFRTFMIAHMRKSSPSFCIFCAFSPFHCLVLPFLKVLYLYFHALDYVLNNFTYCKINSYYKLKIDIAKKNLILPQKQCSFSSTSIFSCGLFLFFSLYYSADCEMGK